MAGESSKPWKNQPGGRHRALWIGVNWIGDTLMSMPAIQAWRRLHPEDELTVLVKPGLRALWQLHAAPDNILTYEESPSGTFAAARLVRDRRFQTAFIAPNSFRTALIPFLARVPERTGTRGHHRAFMLTRPVDTSVDAIRHQALEYFDLLGLPAPLKVEAPRLALSDGALESADGRMEGLPRPLIALMPGAARGPAKRWPVEHFEKLARRLTGERGAGIVLFGGPGDAEACDRIAAACGDRARSFAGVTSLRDWAAMLADCSAAVCNDSGGMHLAAAVGCPLVAIFGRTDPRVTGPLGGRCTIVQAGGGGQRDIARDDAGAVQALAGISPDRIHEALEALLQGAR